MQPFPLTLPRPVAMDVGAQEELLRRARDGDREAVEVLYRRYRDRIVALCFGVLRDHDGAQDAAQEALLRAFDKMPRLESESEFLAWLYRLALNLCLDRRRLHERRAHLLERAPEPLWESPDHAGRIETRLALERALDELEEPARLVLLLREWHELSYDEIAAILRVPVGTVKSRLSCARREFRRVWEEHNGD